MNKKVLLFEYETFAVRKPKYVDINNSLKKRERWPQIFNVGKDSFRLLRWY